jgi:prepilin-type N-terminal cleavage/methylation domain-containing protein
MDMVPRRQGGSTLIEVIMAMVILTIVIVGLNLGVVSLINSNLNSKDLTSATSVGNQLFEEFRRSDYYSLATSADTVRNRFIRNWTIDRLTDTTHAAIDCYVRWPLLSPQKHTITLSTIIARP